jgi:hypothetical protein
MADVTKKDERRAAKFNAKEAESAPLLAFMGVAKTVTPESVAERREKNHADAERHLAEREQKETERQADCRRRILAHVSAEVLAEYLTHYKAGTPEGMPMGIALITAAERAERGEPLYEAVNVAEADSKRTWVDPDLCYDMLRRRPNGYFVHELEACLQATIVDIVAALDVLRDQSRALVKPGGGWVAL